MQLPDGAAQPRRTDNTLVKALARAFRWKRMLESGEFTVHAVYLPRPRIEISGPQGVQASFDWQAARDSVVGPDVHRHSDQRPGGILSMLTLDLDQ